MIDTKQRNKAMCIYTNKLILTSINPVSVFATMEEWAEGYDVVSFQAEGDKATILVQSEQAPLDEEIIFDLSDAFGGTIWAGYIRDDAAIGGYAVVCNGELIEDTPIEDAELDALKTAYETKIDECDCITCEYAIVEDVIECVIVEKKERNKGMLNIRSWNKKIYSGEMFVATAFTAKDFCLLHPRSNAAKEVAELINSYLAGGLTHARLNQESAEAVFTYVEEQLNALYERNIDNMEYSKVGFTDTAVREQVYRIIHIAYAII